MTDMDIFYRLLLAALLTGLIGWERESRGRAAGLRTHLLVGVGSCLTVLMSIALQKVYPNIDPSRIPAQVISGIGFLGAGTIMRYHASIKGLTTAASIWMVACIGLAIGCDYLMGAVEATAIALISLHFLAPAKRKIKK